MKNKKTSIGGVDANIVVLMCYLGALSLSLFYDTKMLAWLLPLIIYIIERENEFVKKHAAQACVLYFFYSMISLIIVLISIHSFNISNIFTLNLNNFNGSLFMASILSLIAMLIFVVVTVISVIICSKVWHYEDYNVHFLDFFVRRFRKFMDNIIDSNDGGKANKGNDIIISEEIKEDDDVTIEDDSEIIVSEEIDEINNETKKESKKQKKEEQ